jgi:RNA polymerase sigma factor (sigma-70 family)
MSRQDKGGAGMILNRGPPSGFETSNKISNSGGTDMYIEHPYFYEGKYYANIDGEMIEITKEVAYAMNNFYRSSKAKKVEIKNELGEVVDKMLREVPYSGQSIDGEGFMIEDFPDLNCDVEHSVLTKMEQQDIHKVIDQLNTEERMIIYSIFFENKTQTQMAEIMGISRQVLAYKLKTILNKMREMYMKEFF